MHSSYIWFIYVLYALRIAEKLGTMKYKVPWRINHDYPHLQLSKNQRLNSGNSKTILMCFFTINSVRNSVQLDLEFREISLTLGMQTKATQPFHRNWWDVISCVKHTHRRNVYIYAFDEITPLMEMLIVHIQIHNMYNITQFDRYVYLCNQIKEFQEWAFDVCWRELQKCSIDFCALTCDSKPNTNKLLPIFYTNI